MMVQPPQSGRSSRATGNKYCINCIIPLMGMKNFLAWIFNAKQCQEYYINKSFTLRPKLLFFAYFCLLNKINFLKKIYVNIFSYILSKNCLKISINHDGTTEFYSLGHNSNTKQKLSRDCRRNLWESIGILSGRRDPWRIRLLIEVSVVIEVIRYYFEKFVINCCCLMVC